jgi:DNA-binding response OmpR family regulator
MEPITSIVLVEADPATRAFLADNLTADGYGVALAQNERAALAALRAAPADLIICDVNGNTLGLLDTVRQADGATSRIDPRVPLIVLTERTDECARVRFLDRGGDDVVSKPFSYTELRSRVRALLRRSRHHRPAPVTRTGAVQIDHAARHVRVGNTSVSLSRTECALLSRLASEPARVFSKTELLRDVWGYRGSVRTRTVDSYACRLRRKLTTAGASHHIQNIWGVGDRLAPIDTPQPQISRR